MATREDALGLPVTGSAEDVALWDRAVDDYLGYEGPDAVEDLVAQAPGLAIGHALLAWLAAMGDVEDVDAQTELAAAERLVAGASERERAFVATVRAGETTPFYALDRVWDGYLREYPADLLARFAVAVAAIFSFRPDMEDVLDRLLAEALEANGRHPFVLSFLGMQAQERGRLDVAHELAAEALAARPGFVPAGHVTTHVHFERGDHATGLPWITGFLRDQMRPGCGYEPHLSWHAGLHELALDDRAAVLRRLAVMAGPEASQDWLLSNGASYLWRLKLAGVVGLDDDPSGGVIAERARDVVGEPPFLFLGWHAAIGLACSGDVPGLRAVATADHKAGAPGVAEVLPAVATAFADLLEDSPSRAADGLLAVLGHGPRLGGSHA
ncbi:MAG TPA: hypothetical protein VFR56_03505, partial [Actinomycetes bacterium]|nr:hypothetical protein [Actinomycetes bacterium]